MKSIILLIASFSSLVLAQVNPYQIEWVKYVKERCLKETKYDNSYYEYWFGESYREYASCTQKYFNSVETWNLFLKDKRYVAQDESEWLDKCKANNCYNYATKIKTWQGNIAPIF